ISAAPTCLRFADYDSINQLFIDGGPGTKVLLCPSKVYRLSGTIVFTAADQELATFGYPTGSERAILRVESNILATAVQGDCRRCARVSIRSLVIDGNRSKLGRVVEGESTGLVVLGGNEGQSIRQCSIQDPRGFTAIHIREGDKLQCTSALIEENQIGPVGEEYDSNVDGPDPEMSPLGRPLADGISIACRNSQVKGNTFYDNTDAAVVLYCAPGTEVTGNTITTRTLSAMAGILAVDAAPFDGDYSGTVIEGNTITAESRTIRVGIGLGSAVWSDDTETVLKGGRVLGNSIKGDYMGFGIAAAGLKNWIVRDNVDTAIHQGRRSARCFEEPINPEPMAMVWDKKSVIDSEVQDDFQDHEFQYVVCIDGLEDKLHLQPIPDLPATVKEPEPEPTEVITFNTGSEVMDDILEHSQDRMLEAIEHLGRVMDI
ncbi:hypothetical protein TREMEDRAFT_13370, partial [Tremella mesenterica DSM 1558]|uniref:uncharacterized protein n=1 Tax=Tremella mesenterica (strain ATCC 24925 / CBS 8224 / DSM 1558 / NBRC 9311 / NRRL Y-6157 / RJB 2259-6 / UBC 559-6) TaxID=578456 RepID=UPI0003F4A3F1